MMADDRWDVRIRSEAGATAARLAPWRPDITWWLVAIQGLAVVLLGLVVLLGQGATELAVALLGAGVAATGVHWAWSAMRSDLPQVVLGWRGVRGGAGVTVGGLLVLDAIVDFVPPSGALVVLAIGLILVGAVGAAEWWAGRDRMAWRWPSLTGSVVASAFGVVVLLSRLQSSPLFLHVLAIAALVIGALLLVRAGVLLRQERDLRRATVGPGASSASTPIAQEGAGAAAPAVTVRSAASPHVTDGDASTQVR